MPWNWGVRLAEEEERGERSRRRAASSKGRGVEEVGNRKEVQESSTLSPEVQ